MSDEVKDAERKIPQSMVLSVLINGAQTFISWSSSCYSASEIPSPH